MSGLARRIVAKLTPWLPAFGGRATPDPAKDRAMISRALSTRLSPRLLKDVGGGEG